MEAIFKLEGLIRDKKIKQQSKIMKEDEKLIAALFSELSESYNEMLKGSRQRLIEKTCL